MSIRAIDLFTYCGLTESVSKARNLINQGGLYINNIKIKNQNRIVTENDLASESFIILRKGKKNYHLIRII